MTGKSLVSRLLEWRDKRRSTHFSLCSAHVTRQLSDNSQSLCELCLACSELSVDLSHALCVREGKQ